MEREKIERYRELLRIKAETFASPKLKGLQLIVADSFPHYIKVREAGLAFIVLEEGVYPVIFNHENKNDFLFYSKDIAFIGFTEKVLREKFADLIGSAKLLQEEPDEFYQILPSLSFKLKDKRSLIFDWLDSFKKGNLYDESNVLIDSRNTFNKRILNLFGQKQERKNLNKAISSLEQKDLAKAILSKNKLIRAQIKLRK